MSNQVEGSKYDASIDLPMYGKTVIHTVPICEGSGCLAVCQFICTERERMGSVSDDGAYHPENTSHFRLLTLLLTFVQKHLDVVMPKPQTAPPPIEAVGSRQPSKKSAEQEAQEQEEKEQEAAAVKLQAIHRGRLARRS